ncbi:hypothetical protein [Streptomyces glaucescens]|uniref:hypothetical protein n=1 Tax=Streptomyces glaucescens TaxID=1907 RepID=UPI000A3BFB0A|nr:hypothetical protein [Streptomyces glaucescens]
MHDNTADDSAASRLATLARYFRERPVTGPAGHSYISSSPRATPTEPAAPAHLSVVDHIDASVRELDEYTRQANPDAGPLPKRVEDAYQWCVDNTADSPETVQLRRDVIFYRQRLEHAIAEGDIKVVRPIRCPACRTLGLMWKARLNAAICTNGKCRTKDGLTRRWTLARLAYAQVEEQRKTVRVRAT